MTICDVVDWLHQQRGSSSLKVLIVHAGVNDCRATGTVSTETWCDLIHLASNIFPHARVILSSIVPARDYDDEEIEDFYGQLQGILDQTPKKDIVVVQGDWNAKVGEDACKDWKETCGRHCNKESNEKGLRLLEFASYNDLKLMNTFGPHKATSEEDQKARIKFDFEKLKDPQIAEAFQVMIGGKFAPLTVVDADGSDIEMGELIDTFNTAVTETAKEILGKHRSTKKPWIISDILDLCDKRRELKNKKGETEGVKKYRAVNQQIKKSMIKAKENWIKEQCQEIEKTLKQNNSKKAYQLVKKLTSTRQERTTTIQDKTGKCITEEQDILKRWTEYCSELYGHRATGDPEVLNVPPATNNDNHPILREEVEAAVKSLKKGKWKKHCRRFYVWM
ncbi:uncharacterized protein LOC143299552 [Babylonia areolata]|uniref:uncharacterized protein LOC143299552 n=1 Tax=Babylonia areolata TaxID=304850 RepID=UPI003FD3B44C